MFHRNPNINGHFRNLNWRYLPYIEVLCKAYVRGYTHKIWPYMVQYLHFRILEFPLIIVNEGFLKWGYPKIIQKCVFILGKTNGLGYPFFGNTHNYSYVQICVHFSMPPQSCFSSPACTRFTHQHIQVYVGICAFLITYYMYCL